MLQFFDPLLVHPHDILEERVIDLFDFVPEGYFKIKSIVGAGDRAVDISDGLLNLLQLISPIL